MKLYVYFQKNLQIILIKIKIDMRHAGKENFVVHMENVSQRISDVMEKAIVKMEAMRQEYVALKICLFIKILVIFLLKMNISFVVTSYFESFRFSM